MKVRELMEVLSNVDPEAEVVMSKDAEGNGYSPFSHLWSGCYVAHTTWSGEAFDMSPDECPDGPSVAAIILKPIN